MSGSVTLSANLDFDPVGVMVGAGMDAAVWLGAAVALNVAVAVAGMLWSPSHHRALASMLGVTWLNRPPLFRWEGKLRRGFRARAGVGLFALREIVLTVGGILVGTGVALVVSAWALLAGQAAGAGSVLLAGRVVTNATDMLVALGVHFVAVRAPDAAALMASPSAVFPSGLWVTALLLSVGLVVTAAGLRAVAELCRVMWFTAVCMAFPSEAAVALEERRGSVRWALAIPRAAP